MNTESNKSKFFYGWVIVFAGALISATSIGIGWNSFGQFIKPICADLGFSRQAMSTTMTVLSLMQMVINFFWGYIFKRFSLKKMLRLKKRILHFSVLSLQNMHLRSVRK